LPPQPALPVRGAEEFKLNPIVGAEQIVGDQSNQTERSGMVDLGVQLEKLEAAGCDKVFRKKRSGVDAGRPELKRCLDYLREGDTLLVTKIDRLALSTADLYRIVSALAEKGVAFKVVDDPTIDTTSRTGKLVMGILALIAEFEGDIRYERQMDGIRKARDRGVRFGRKPLLVPETVKQVRKTAEGRQDSAGDHAPDAAIKGFRLPSLVGIGPMSA
jgi:DNA invertase Pin-like site-specific DNA recombinase